MKLSRRLLCAFLSGVFCLSLLLAGCASSEIPSWEEMYNLGIRYLDESNYDEAIVMFNAALEINPNYAMAYAHRADAYISLAENTEDPEKRQEYLNQAEEDIKKAAESEDEAVQDVIEEKTERIEQIRKNPPSPTETAQETQPATMPETTEETFPTETTSAPTQETRKPYTPPVPAETAPPTTAPAPTQAPAPTEAPVPTEAPTPVMPDVSVDTIIPDMGNLVVKPVIYLYPEEETEVQILLDIDGDLTTTYPHYNNGWNVIAQPDGTLTDPKTGREYYCLFWEAASTEKYDWSEGFVVAGRDVEKFLEESLATMGLSEKEANEFIIYWLPQMEFNDWNLITFQQECYTDHARLHITPEPDSITRVFMVWKSIPAPIDLPAQTLPTFERKGFTVVEWGGSKIVNE